MSSRFSKNVVKLWFGLFIMCVVNTVSAKSLIIDDRSSGELRSNLGEEWRLVTDDVMGGISSGKLELDSYQGKNCLRMQGDVSTENNGGFVQVALNLVESGSFDASAYDGVELEVAGNNESYNLHLRTAGLWFPWQSYRASFDASNDWQTIRIPFAELVPYKTGQSFKANKLKRIGIVAIGRDFQADLCFSLVKFYTD